MRKRRSYYHVADGEWITVARRGYRDQCCDCGLIHDVDFRVNEHGQIQYRAKRNGKATGGARSHKGRSRHG